MLTVPTRRTRPFPRGYFHFGKASRFSVFLRLVTTGQNMHKKAGLPRRFPVRGIRHFQAVSMSALCPLFSGFLFSFELKNLKKQCPLYVRFFLHALPAFALFDDWQDQEIFNRWLVIPRDCYSLFKLLDFRADFYADLALKTLFPALVNVKPRFFI